MYIYANWAESKQWESNDTLYISVELKRNLIEMSLLQWMVGSRYGFVSENYQTIFGY